MRNIKFGQNFITNYELVNKLVSKSGIHENELWLDVGSGKGIILNELLKYTSNVVGIELDKNLYLKLKDRFQNIEIVNTDFISYEVGKEYRIFSNIPFNHTADIMKKLLEDNNFKGGYIVMQLEAFFKFAGESAKKHNSFQSILWNMFFDISKVHAFDRHDFNPSPGVHTVLVKVERKEDFNTDFADFVIYLFENSTPTIKRILSKTGISGINLNRKPSELKLSEVLEIYKYLLKTNSILLNKSRGKYIRNRQISASLEKVNRTRVYKS